MNRFSILAIILLGISLVPTRAQTPMWNNQGALVSIRDSATVYVRGDLLNDQTGEMDNSSTLYVEGNWTNDANNEAFRSRGQGVVHLQGDNPRIGGQSITRFYDLRLEQRNIAYANIAVYVDGFLRLNAREFAVDTHTVYVYNAALNAVEHTALRGNWGFLSSLQQGGLWRATDQVASYWYPVGSSLNNRRFAPVAVIPTTTAPSAFKVGLLNNDPNTDGYDRNRRAYRICDLQATHYHQIRRPLGTTPADVQFWYDAAWGGTWTSVTQWTTGQRWDSVQLGTAGFDATYQLETLVTTRPVDQFLPPPMTLARQSPDVDLAVAPNPICADNVATVTANSSAVPFDRYDFYVDGRLVQSGPSDVYNLRGTRSGDLPLWVVGAFSDCGDESDTVVLTVFDSVVATISNDTIILAGTPAELRAGGGDFYRWTPDSALGCAICPITAARPSQTLRYLVQVESMDGCVDTAGVWVEVRPSVGDVLFVPNVLTPNNDGFNDTWFIRNIELFPNNTVSIINRWGDVVFSTTNYANNWDGTYSGGPLPAGTYYYVLDVGGDLGLFKGDLTIIRE